MGARLSGLKRGKLKIYNSPRNWPTPPPGWQPHEGWHPDPSWGPAPPGHEFWIEVPAGPVSTVQRGRTLPTTAIVLAGVALVLCWIPILNVLGLLLGLAAVVLGVIALFARSRFQSSMKGTVIAALAMGGVSLLGALMTISVYAPIFDSSSNASVSTGTSSAPPTPSQTPSHKTTPIRSGTAAQPHPVGTVALLGKEYQAAITGVKLNANDDVMANNRYNHGPDGQYVLVDISVTYVGAGEGTPWLDLSPTFVGSDARQYDSDSCSVSLANGEMKVPTLEKGGSANYQVCMDVPPGAIEGGKIFIQNDWSYRDQQRTYWALH